MPTDQRRTNQGLEIIPHSPTPTCVFCGEANHFGGCAEMRAEQGTGDKEGSSQAGTMTDQNMLRAALEPFAKKVDYVNEMELADHDYVACAPLQARDYRRAKAAYDALATTQVDHCGWVTTDPADFDPADIARDGEVEELRATRDKADLYASPHGWDAIFRDRCEIFVRSMLASSDSPEGGL